ncbi:hypothetical protein QJQ45_000826 [Haematococcus lacustris]|nr:hypothetical protein QJQ45_000826 [Haematococcus lacustris]
MEEDNQPTDPNPPPQGRARSAAAAAAGGPNQAPAGKAPGKTAAPGSRPASPNQVQRSAAAAAAAGPSQTTAKTVAPGRPTLPNQTQRNAAATAAVLNHLPPPPPLPLGGGGHSAPGSPTKSRPLSRPLGITAQDIKRGSVRLGRLLRARLMDYGLSFRLQCPIAVSHGSVTQPCIFNGKPKLLADATARLNAHRVMAKIKHKKDPGKKQKVSRSAQGKQRQDRRDGWTTRRRQVTAPPYVSPRPAGWKSPAGQVEQRLVRPAWSQERDQPVRGLVWCPVVAPRKPPQAPHSGQATTQPAASEPGPSTPPPAKRSKPAAEPTKGKGKGKAAKAKPAPQPGRWLDRDCNAALNMQRIGESRWRPLELCYWPEQGALPAKGKEYPGLGYKRVRDKPPKAQEQQQQPAEAQ